MTPDLVTAWIHPKIPLHYASKVFAGLVGVARTGAIRLRFRAGLPPWMTAPPDDMVGSMYLTVAPRDEPPVSVAIDLQDQGHLINLPALSACDHYLKRGYDPTAAPSVPPDLWAKVSPLGLIYPCRDWRTGVAFLPAWTTIHLGRAVRSFSFGRFFRKVKSDLRTYLTLPTARSFERTPESPAEPVVLFQTRVWEPEEGADQNELDEVNASRAALVRGLREAFGPRFRGG
jgi:hypothetical protein